MKQHFSEADLLETYYTQPGESMPVMMHLADCADCSARYERLDRKVRSLTACDHDAKPETFWARQRMLVMRKIDAQRARRAANLFDLRRMIGGLFLIYGAILVILGLGASDAEVEKAAGWNLNLWVGVAMLITAAIFLAWAFARPLG